MLMGGGLMVSQRDAKRDPQELPKEPKGAKRVRERQPEPVQGARRQPPGVQEGAKCAERRSRGGHITSKMPQSVPKRHRFRDLSKTGIFKDLLYGISDLGSLGP